MEQMVQLPKNGLTILDCYCGAGVGAIGAEYAGFTTVFAFDINKHAVRNFNKNIDNVAHIIDAKTLDDDAILNLPSTDIITGGFPCKPWSTAGKREGEHCDKNGNLAQKLIDIILIKKPKAFLIENVKGLVDKKNKPYFLEMIKQLEQVYNVNWKLIDCSEYGVPQKRERVFIIGIRNDLNKSYVFPDKSPISFNVLDAIGDLSEIPDNVNNHDFNEKYFLRNDEKPYAHKIPDGGNWKNLPIQDQKDFMKGAFDSSGGKTTFLAVVDKNKPARTIMSTVMGKNSAQIVRRGSILRRFTVRESLRLQTVPDFWQFDSDTPPNIQYERCSGIPSLVSYKLMKNIESSLNGIEKDIEHNVLDEWL